MDIEHIKNLKKQGEQLSIFIFNLLNSNKNNPLHELFKEEEPQSTKDLCEQLCDYALNLTLNYPSLLKFSPEHGQIIAAEIQQLDQVVGEFHDKYYTGAKNADLDDDIRLLANFFATNHVVIEQYLNYLLVNTAAKHDLDRAKL